MKEIRERRVEDLAVGDDAAALPEDSGVEEDLLADHGIVLVVGVVGITKLAIGPELELQELVPELSLMPHVIPEVELSIVFPGRHLSVGCKRWRRMAVFPWQRLYTVNGTENKLVIGFQNSIWANK